MRDKDIEVFFSNFHFPRLSEEEEEEDCVPERTHQSGLTVWRRVSLDLETLSLDRHDFTFSSQIWGEKVPLATAGDCFSTAGCPRGAFSLNLAGTGLVVARETVWLEEGHFTSINITRDKVKQEPWKHLLLTFNQINQISIINLTVNDLEPFQTDVRVGGRCGGYCGSCYPQHLKLSLAPLSP